MFGRRKRHETDQHAIVRLIQQRDDAAEAAQARDAEIEALRQEIGESRDECRALRHRLEEAQGTLTVIQASLGEVAVYKGMTIGHESVVLYVNELVRDHEELERRIDATMLECAAAMDGDSIPVSLFAQQVGRILQGGAKTPDTIEGLDA